MVKATVLLGKRLSYDELLAVLDEQMTFVLVSNATALQVEALSSAGVVNINHNLADATRLLDGEQELHTRLQQSEWKHASGAEIPLKGLTFDDVWNNIVAEIGSLDNAAEETLEQQIINREEKEKLLRQIEALEKRARIEKQTRKKYELHQQIMKLKKELAE